MFLQPPLSQIGHGQGCFIGIPQAGEEEGERAELWQGRRNCAAQASDCSAGHSISAPGPQLPS